MLELFFSFDALLFLASLFGPYVLGTLCPGGALPFTNDCVAVLTGSSSVWGTSLTVLLQLSVTGIGLYYSVRLMLGSWALATKDGLSGDWKGLAMGSLVVIAGILLVVFGSVYFGFV